MKRIVSALTLLVVAVAAFTSGSQEMGMDADHVANSSPKVELPQDQDLYWGWGQSALQQTLNRQVNTNKAKNVILFVADGWGVSTITAQRILEGQMIGMDGEEHTIFVEAFPFSSLVKTYNVNQQVPDSAGTSTAMQAGVKTDVGVIGVDSDIVRGDHGTLAGNEVLSILQLAEMAGMATGVVSTARITHATPAASYAHSADRNYEDDKDIPEANKALGAVDIARQLIEFPYGDGLEVAMGGGRRSFIPGTMDDPEDAGRTGERLDGRDLTQEWVQQYSNAEYVWNLEQFEMVNPTTTEHLLGLFNRSHMQYEADRKNDAGGEPSLTQMTEKAIQILDNDPDGFYLMVESGRVDHAHHATNAYRSLTDAIEFTNAVKAAYAMTDPNETLIVVTADHSHVFTIAGYPARGNNILGLSRNAAGELNLAQDGKPYTTLGYANGATGMVDGQDRQDLTNVDTTDTDFVQQALVPLSSETHSGEDIAVFANGPWAHLFQNTQEQSYIFHVMDYALDLRGKVLAATGGNVDVIPYHTEN